MLKIITAENTTKSTFIQLSKKFNCILEVETLALSSQKRFSKTRKVSRKGNISQGQDIIK